MWCDCPRQSLDFGFAARSATPGGSDGRCRAGCPQHKLLRSGHPGRGVPTLNGKGNGTQAVPYIFHLFSIMGISLEMHPTERRGRRSLRYSVLTPNCTPFDGICQRTTGCFTKLHRGCGKIFGTPQSPPPGGHPRVASLAPSGQFTSGWPEGPGEEFGRKPTSQNNITDLYQGCH